VLDQVGSRSQHLQREALLPRRVGVLLRLVVVVDAGGVAYPFWQIEQQVGTGPTKLLSGDCSTFDPLVCSTSDYSRSPLPSTIDSPLRFRVRYYGAELSRFFTYDAISQRLTEAFPTPNCPDSYNYVHYADLGVGALAGPGDGHPPGQRQPGQRQPGQRPPHHVGVMGGGAGVERDRRARQNQAVGEAEPVGLVHGRWVSRGGRTCRLVRAGAVYRVLLGSPQQEWTVGALHEAVLEGAVVPPRRCVARCTCYSLTGSWSRSAAAGC
jgi:hypothetical protein